MGGQSGKPNPLDMSDISRRMQMMFRRVYKGKYGRNFNIFLDPDGTLSQFTAYRGVFGGMVVCQVILPPEWSGGRMIVWFFRRRKSTPIRLEVWAGSVKTEFPKGCLDPAMIKMEPSIMQCRYMTNPHWQKLRVKRQFQ